MARGGIYPRTNADGEKVFLIRYRTADGRQVKKTISTSLREAERALTAALGAVDRGELRSGGSERFAAYARRWVEEHRPRVEHGTYADYRKSIELYLVPALGDRKLSAITPGELRALIAQLVKTETRAGHTLRPKTVNNIIVPLRLMLGHAVEDGLIPSNPAATSPGSRQRLRLPAEHVEMEYLRLAEIPTYLEACADEYRTLAEVLVGCGLRISEALALTWIDLDLAAGAIVVVRSRKDGGRVGSTKSDVARRVEIGPRLAGLLADHQAREREHRVSPLVFTRQDGTSPVDRSQVSRRWHARALAAAGIERHVRLHDLRHTYAAATLAAGESLVFVQQQLGHADIHTTQRHYGHLEHGYLRDAALRAEAAVWSGTKVGPSPV
jgi:integrase